METHMFRRAPFGFLRGVGLLGAMAGALSGPQIQSPRTIDVPIPAYIRELPRRNRNRLKRKYELTVHRVRATEQRRRRRRQYGYGQRGSFQSAVNSLTNYERHQWVKAGRPGKTKEALKLVLSFKGCRARRVGA